MCYFLRRRYKKKSPSPCLQGNLRLGPGIFKSNIYNINLCLVSLENCKG